MILALMYYINITETCMLLMETYRPAKNMQNSRTYLSIVELSQSRASVGQEKVPTQYSHLVSKLHVCRWSVWKRPFLQVDDPTMHQERGVNDLGDLGQTALTSSKKKEKETVRVFERVRKVIILY